MAMTEDETSRVSRMWRHWPRGMPSCDGVGYLDEEEEEECPDCGGTGTIECSECDGVGEIDPEV